MAGLSAIRAPADSRWRHHSAVVACPVTSDTARDICLRKARLFGYIMTSLRGTPVVSTAAHVRMTARAVARTLRMRASSTPALGLLLLLSRP
ncbi:hypothetical protein AE618_00785 [Bosea vaviloviae]|uniref:Uncharacterized protein n=1 Tax=Bosea vaviloviae TaxID=1526658 RepID=A0A0N0MD34_9HYPH|nr:hypothetical protein AE618_00785 [Bosea vaviloviae]